jgi:FkbM family methyltransferase
MPNIYKYTIKSPILNKGKPVDVLCDYEGKEFNIQFSEIFQLGQYKGGRKKNAVILDVGANIGLSVLYFKDIAKKIYAIEPNNTYYQFLMNNVSKYKKVKTFNLGLGAENGTGVLISNPGEDRMESTAARGDKKQPFKMMTIDKFFEENKIKHIDVMKVDTEGSEYPIFMSEGFAKVADKIDIIVGESHYVPDLFPEYIPHILKDYGFKVRFLPINNMINYFQLIGSEGKPLSKYYKVFKQTIFKAWKE